MAKNAIVSGAQLSVVSRGDDPPYPSLSAFGGRGRVLACWAYAD